MWLWTVLGIFAVPGLAPSHAAENPAVTALKQQFQARTYTDAQGRFIPYRLFVPADYNAQKKYPLVLFLHGAGQRGINNTQQVSDALVWAKPENQAKHSCLVLAPQCPDFLNVFEVVKGQSPSGIADFATYKGGGTGVLDTGSWKPFSIPVGKYVHGPQKYLVFVGARSRKQPGYEVAFRNLRVNGKPVDFPKNAALSSYNNPANIETVAASRIEPGGSTVVLNTGEGNVTSVKLDCPVDLGPESVLTFEFKATTPGGTHLIGFDTDNQMQDSRWVNVNWGDGTPHQMPAQPSEPLGLVIGLLDALQKEFSIDADRLYVTGLSMGGFGTWDLISRFPNKFAAAVPICGGADNSQAPKLTHLPIWAFHGSSDGIVRTVRTRSMIAALEKAGGHPKYTEYPGVGHGCWGQAYAEPELPDWLFAQKRGVPSPASGK
jgi:poly(3-hydroxybutyrate) depolymerase